MKAESHTAIRITRRIGAPPERVFDAWLDRKMIGQWMFGPAVRDERGQLAEGLAGCCSPGANFRFQRFFRCSGRLGCRSGVPHSSAYGPACRFGHVKILG